ncbi:MAG: hypothetical protein AUG50_04140 [Betaproteobacteria bacterium 13_1_20CM_3_63_8]|nr:MAG: hypothetical protein AUG50_04140 [Betaproteobacteria bacterium 13_1_20CM_3_63_8]
MTVSNKMARPNAAPALFRLLSDSSLSRAALSACGLPVVLIDAQSPARAVTYVNPAFAAFFGFRDRLLGDMQARQEIQAWGKDGHARHVEVTVGAIRSVDGRQSHWVLAFSDRTEIERLRGELRALKTPAKAA